MKFTLRQLSVFLAIAEHQQITLAAEKIHLTQSAMSMALQDLERMLNVRLCIRQSKKKLTLTPAGLALRPLAFSLLQQAEAIEKLYPLNTQSEATGKIVLGASTTIGNYVLPTLIGNFLKLHPKVKIALDVANTAEIVKNLQDWRYDFALIEGDAYGEPIVMEQWLEDELILVAQPDHPLAQKADLCLADLEGCKWVVRESGSGTREIMEQLLKKLSRVEIAITASSSEAIKQIMKEGDYLSCLSQFVLKQEIQNEQLKMLSIKDLALKRYFYLIFLSDRQLSPAAEALLKSLRSEKKIINLSTRQKEK